MSLRTKLVGAGFTAAFLFAFAITGFAQQPQTPGTDRGPRPERMGRPGREGRGGAMGQRLGHVLDLTDAQKQQIRAAEQQNREANRGQHEELRQLAEKRRQGGLTAAEEARAKALREEMQASRRRSHESLLSILTPEQRTKLEELRKERKERRHEMHERHKNRGELRAVKPGEIN
jgi:periplasmic protein CpxP/Spy